MRGWPLVFWLAAAFNGMVGAALLLAPASVYALAHWTMAPVFEVRFIGWFVLVFAIGYGIVARDPLGNRGIVLMCSIGKAGAALLVWGHVFAGQAPALFAMAVAGDAVWTAVFVLFLWRTRGARA